MGNLKYGILRDSSYLGSGRIVGKVSDYIIKGMEGERDSEIVAAYYFLIQKIV